MMSPRRYGHWEARTVTLFGNWVFADVIQLRVSRRGRPRLQCTLHPMMSILMKGKREEDTLRRSPHETGRQRP